MRTSTLPRAIGAFLIKYGLSLAAGVAGGWLLQTIVAEGVHVFNLG